ncbi:uncharacterized protein CcaverHIS019_0505330 [Cutaneotrichosporon cavernicola]|uniref:Glycoside hydrolase family 5 domain-containing protein n=1 Tax=Cutaneotrichosporon cavernicola TaxID=279322 RepID=A0AA48L6N2_9TREE|nr:uncharacterized protein CcaverHIS019_0505330 [Cutaneotrichosporon cavernicola]BEI92905.1 hypothetical protein CcaverHIS019_0505330 [Cutaneotrichosporon cavernicola]BEJ00681.1 hypothetical protein CcaverHIS631_0505380 [Cutaneotrichosporon cavernicola]
MGILDKIKDLSKPAVSGDQQYFQPSPTSTSLPLEQSLKRYRKQRGVNLGSWFTTEDWLATELYKHAVEPRGSDFDLARAPNAKALMEHHWDTWITDSDWEWIRSKGFNSVRLPIGYYHLAGVWPDIVKGTDYAPYADVYEGAWPRILNAIDRAGRYGLGVLVDFHAAAGAQNTDGHSGMSGGTVNFWDKSNLKSTALALRFLASTLAPNPHVIGLELLNEPKNDSRLQKWYESTIDELRPLTGPDFPIYVSDAWDTNWYAQWAGRRSDFIVVDHHLYRCFTPEDKAIDGRGHAAKLAHEFAPKFIQLCGQAPIVVGEWSAGLDDSGLPPDTPASERDAQKRAWVTAQLDLYERAAGYWFWTLKTDRPWDAGWSAYNASQAEILPASMVRRTLRQPGDRTAACHQACDAHCAYWGAHGGKPNAHVFNSAFCRGWDDAAMFLRSEGQAEIGFVTPWSRHRRDEFAQSGQLGDDAWQWDHGFEQGVQALTAQALE